jgi:para-aminobenzoate synthetase component II
MPQKILLVDNNDSFTFNIVELIRSIKGEKPVIGKSSLFKIKELQNFQSIIFSPGPGLPSDFPAMNKILAQVSGLVPILGICLGHQAICEFYGLELINLNEVVHGQSKKIRITGNSILFRGLPSSFNVGLYHSWVAKNNFDNNNLNITSVSDDGHIMSVENPLEKVWGVQFHPESYITNYGKELIANFLEIR